jgi:HAD domain in Swiss Army Knife RNA repair proteins
MILFLDFDGVLHPDPCYDQRRLFEHVPLLAAVLARFPQARIVLSTSWRTEKSLDELRALLGALAPRVLGTTPHFSSFRPPARLQPFPRHAECMHWLVAAGAAEREWVALDDRASLFAPDCDRLIECDSTRGLDEASAGRLCFALARAQRASALAH